MRENKRKLKASDGYPYNTYLCIFSIIVRRRLFRLAGFDFFSFTILLTSILKCWAACSKRMRIDFLRKQLAFLFVGSVVELLISHSAALLVMEVAATILQAQIYRKFQSNLWVDTLPSTRILVNWTLVCVHSLSNGQHDAFLAPEWTKCWRLRSIGRKYNQNVFKNWLNSFFQFFRNIQKLKAGDKFNSKSKPLTSYLTLPAVMRRFIFTTAMEANFNSLRFNIFQCGHCIPQRLHQSGPEIH